MNFEQIQGNKFSVGCMVWPWLRLSHQSLNLLNIDEIPLWITHSLSDKMGVFGLCVLYSADRRELQHWAWGQLLWSSMDCRNRGVRGPPPPPDVGKPVYPIQTRGEDYAHHITNCHCIFRPSYGPDLQWAYPLIAIQFSYCISGQVSTSYICVCITLV